MSSYLKDSQYTVLRKLAEIGEPMNLLEIGFSATAQVVRNLAQRGFVKVEVKLTPRGAEAVQELRLRRERQKIKAAGEQKRGAA